MNTELFFPEKPNDKRFRDETGNIFGYLKVIGYAGKFSDRDRELTYYCLCVCQKIVRVKVGNLRSGNSMSCGCQKGQLITNKKIKHGHARRNKVTSIFTIWSSMIERCGNPNSEFYYRYGGRGIKVCERWLKFENFLEDMGERPAGLTIERVDNDLGYFKENCRWADRTEQANNRRSNRYLTLNGETKSLSEWAKFVGVNPSTISCRLKNGWPIRDAISIPVLRNKFRISHLLNKQRLR